MERIALSRNLIVLVNPNKVHPPVAPYALDVLATSLAHHGYDVEVVDLCFARDQWREVLARYFASADPLLVGVSIRNTDTVYALEQRSFVPEHKEVIDEIRRLCQAPIVAGGVGFSTMPFALVDCLGVDFGVKGPGERIVCALANALASGRSPDTVPDLLINRAGSVTMTVPAGPAGSPAARALPLSVAAADDRVEQVERASSYVRRSNLPTMVDNLAYYRSSGLSSILTKNGCIYRCSHCVEPDAKGARTARRDVSAVVDEMESLLEQGIYDLHTTDSEFNLPIGHGKNLLKEMVRRKSVDRLSPLHQMRLWVYCQPAPFDEELAELLAAAGCAGINVGADHLRLDMLDGWKVTGGGTRYYTHEDTVRLVGLCQQYGMLTMVEALFGMPGETAVTMRECIDAYLALNATVTGFSLGLRLFPYTPLAIGLAERCDGVRTVPGLQSNTARGPIILKPLAKCADRVEYERQFMFDESGAIRLVCYFSPDLPEDAATVADPAGRRHRSVQFLWDHIPAGEHYRVMLPTMAGMSEHDNNYADNPFLTSLAELGYTGAFWAHWRDRESILTKAREAGITAAFS
jgi:tryptophan 2-C-methyltransferase